MKSPGIIYRQYRKIYRKELQKKLQEKRKRTHENCIYGKAVEDDNKKFELCMYSCSNFKDIKEGIVNPDLIGICTHPEGCDAFACKYTKNEVESELRNELENPTIKYKKHPELSSLEWVLDKSLNDAKKNPDPVANIIVSIIDFLEHMLKVTCGSGKNLMRG